VLVNDLTLSGERNVVNIDLGLNLKKHDLIRLVGNKDFGIILSIDKDNLRILDSNN